MTTKKSFLFCFAIGFEKKLNCYLPMSYIIEQTDAIAYLNKKASPEVLKSFGVVFEDLDASTKKVLTLCNNLKPEAIFKKFSTKIKSAKTFDDLFNDPKVSFGIHQFLKVNLSQFYSLVKQENFPLAIHLDADKNFSKSRITTNQPPLEPQLHFDKHTNGITYTLTLKDQETVFYPSNTTIEVLLDEPAWVVIDKKLFELQGINAKKISPFLTKKAVEIPNKNVSDYFEKFIREIAKKATVTATGFEIETRDQCISCEIQPVFDFIKKAYYVNLFFDYKGYTFEKNTAKKIHTSIDLSDGNQKLIQYKRSESEAFYSDQLVVIGLSKTENGYFKLASKTATQNPFSTIQWVIENKQKLIYLGFTIEDLKIDTKKIDTQQVNIHFLNELKNDWFDIKMTVVADGFAF